MVTFLDVIEVTLGCEASFAPANAPAERKPTARAAERDKVFKVFVILSSIASVGVELGSTLGKPAGTHTERAVHPAFRFAETPKKKPRRKGRGLRWDRRGCRGSGFCPGGEKLN